MHEGSCEKCLDDFTEARAEALITNGRLTLAVCREHYDYFGAAVGSAWWQPVGLPAWERAA